MPVKHTALAAAVLLALGLPTGALGQDATPLDEITLKNGSRILGTVVASEAGSIRIETDFAGTLTINSDEIQGLKTRGALVLQLKDGTVIRDQPMQVEDETLLVTQPGGEQLSLALAEITNINPEPWQLGEGYHWTGAASFAFRMERGNSKIDQLDARLDTSWRSLRDRYTLLMFGNLDEANDQKNADNWTVQAKYDRFLSDVSYWGVQTSLESDEFQDLDLRAFIGPYYGRQWSETGLLDFSTELGLGYTDESFIVDDDRDYAAANWAIDMTSNYLGGDSRLYLHHTGLLNLDAGDEVILKTRMGVAFPLLYGLEGAAELFLDYNSGAAPGVEELDEIYSFRVGYAW